MISRRQLTEAVRELRLHFGETQQKFAARLNAAVITIARWETNRPPSGPSLEQLLGLSRTEGVSKCEQVFQEAANGNVELPPEDSRDRLDFLNTREKALALALVTMLRDPERYAEGLNTIEPALKKCLDDFTTVFRAEDLDERVARAAIAMDQKGVPPEQIAGTLGIGIEAIEKIVALNQFGVVRPLKRVIVHRKKTRTVVVNDSLDPAKPHLKKHKKRLDNPAGTADVGTAAKHVLYKSRKLAQVIERSLRIEGKQ